MDRKRLALVIACSAGAAGGCVPAHELARIEPVMSTRWSTDDLADAPTSASANLATLLASPELGALVERARTQNTDIRIAGARIAQASALLKEANLSVFPEVSLSGGASRARTLNSTLPDLRDVFAKLDVAFELDVFGRLAAGKASAASRVEAAELNRDAIALAIESDVALAYVQRAALQRRIEILDENIARATELERVIRVRFENGAANRVDLGLQSVQLLNLRAERSEIETALDQTRTALAVLVGEEAPRFDVAAARIEDFALPVLRPPSPADLLAARPDVRAAEALVAAADGDVRAARAAFFPRLGIDLSAAVSGAPGGPLSQVVQLGSSLLAPIFSRGRLEGEFAFASASQIEAVETYRRTILDALAETEDANSAVLRSAERAALYAEIVEVARRTAALANLQYIEGEEDLQSVLDAQEFLADAEEAQALAAQAQLASRIAMYRTIGGTLKAMPSASPRLAY